MLFFTLDWVSERGGTYFLSPHFQSASCDNMGALKGGILVCTHHWAFLVSHIYHSPSSHTVRLWKQTILHFWFLTFPFSLPLACTKLHSPSHGCDGLLFFAPHLSHAIQIVPKVFDSWIFYFAVTWYDIIRRKKYFLSYVRGSQDRLPMSLWVEEAWIL